MAAQPAAVARWRRFSIRYKASQGEDISPADSAARCPKELAGVFCTVHTQLEGHWRQDLPGQRTKTRETGKDELQGRCDLFSATA